MESIKRELCGISGGFQRKRFWDCLLYTSYNVEALKAIGLTEETVPKTWSEFKDAAVKFKEAGYIGYSIPMSMDNYSDVNNEDVYKRQSLHRADSLSD